MGLWWDAGWREVDSVDLVSRFRGGGPNVPHVRTDSRALVRGRGKAGNEVCENRLSGSRIDESMRSTGGCRTGFFGGSGDQVFSPGNKCTVTVMAVTVMAELLCPRNCCCRRGEQQTNPAGIEIQISDIFNSPHKILRGMLHRHEISVNKRKPTGIAVPIGECPPPYMKDPYHGRFF